MLGIEIEGKEKVGMVIPVLVVVGCTVCEVVDGGGTLTVEVDGP